MNKQEEALMTKYGITYREKAVYYYKKFQYEDLKDALRFAKIDVDREQASKLPK